MPSRQGRTATGLHSLRLGKNQAERENPIVENPPTNQTLRREGVGVGSGAEQAGRFVSRYILWEL